MNTPKRMGRPRNPVPKVRLDLKVLPETRETIEQARRERETMSGVVERWARQERETK